MRFDTETRSPRAVACLAVHGNKREPMSKPAPPVVPQAAPLAAPDLRRITELRVSGHLMLLDPGLFCIFQPPGAPAAGRSGLPGVRISPAPMTPPGAVEITTFRADGWLPGGDGAALVRVGQGPTQGPAPILVTIYQAPDAAPDAAPRLQVLRLSADPAAPVPMAGVPMGAMPTMAPNSVAPATPPEIVAHVQRTGDIGARFGDWIGVRDSKLWIEGFSILPGADLAGVADKAADTIEYQGVLGRDWVSPWVEAGGFCGSRGMALPLLGLNVRLKGEAARRFDCAVTASFVDGTVIEAAPAGTVLQSKGLAPLEAFRLVLRPFAAGIGGATGGAGPARKTARRPR